MKNMLVYYEEKFLNLLQEKFQKEIELYNLNFKMIKLNDQDVLLLIISTNNNRRMNCSVRDTNIIFNKTEDENGNEVYEIIVVNDSIESLFSKIKKTIFDICLIR